MSGNASAKVATHEELTNEWKKARKVIENLDSSLTGLSKYGFSFITAIIAADSIIGQATGQAVIVVKPSAKLAIVLTTVVLIVALYTMDRFYRAIQIGASLRAIEIEKKIGLGLTTQIADVFQKEKAGRFVELLYYGFVLAAVILGIVLVWPSDLLEGLLIGGGAGAFAFIFAVNWSLSSH